MYEGIVATIKAMSKVPDNQIGMFIKMGQVRDFKTGECFIEAGEIPTQIAFNLRGLFRYFYIDDNGNEYRVIETAPNGNKIVLAYLSKNKLGIWSLSSSDSSDKSTRQLASIGWMREAGIKRYSA
jgi:hypothetical protein